MVTAKYTLITVLRADTRTTTFYIGLYDLTQDKLVVEFTVNDVRTSGKTGV